MRFDDSNIITEEIIIPLDAPMIQTINDDFKKEYGMTANEYADFRNDLLKKYNYKLPLEILERELVKKIVIDLTSRKYLEPSITTDGIEFVVTLKGYQAIVEAYDKNLLPCDLNDSLKAISYLRNHDLLR